MRTSHRFTRTTATATGLALALTLSACGGSSTPAATTPAATASSNASTGATATTSTVTVSDAWAKAMPDLSTSRMTAVFGVVTNTGTQPVTVTGATTSASPMTELHETVVVNGEKAMRKVEGGFTLQPGAKRELKPGGDHIMVMGLTSPVPVGQKVKVTLALSDGTTTEFDAVAKPFSAADERYDHGSGHGGHGGTGTKSMAPTPTDSATPAPLATSH